MSKKFLAFFLALIMLLTVTVPAFAEGYIEPEGTVVTCIGDSIANGYAQDWNCETTPLGTPYNNAAHRTDADNPTLHDIVYMSQELHDELYDKFYYSYYKGLAYARYGAEDPTSLFCVLNGYVDSASVNAVKQQIETLSEEISISADAAEKAELSAQKTELEAKLSNMIENKDEINAGLIRRYETKTLRTFPAQVAAELNGHHVSDFSSFDEFYAAVPYRSLTSSGLRAKDVRYMLDPEYKAKIDAETEHENLWYYFGDYIRADGRTVTKDYYDRMLDGTDLLLYQLGGNDVFSAALYQLDGSNGDGVPENLPEYLKYVISYLPDAIKNLNWVLDYCLDKNPDMTVMLVGVYDYYLNNDLSTLKYNLEEDSETLLMNAFLLVTSTLNAAMRNYADTHKNVFFVDTNGVETLSYETQSGDSTHPSNEGHDYIARRIISALPEEFAMQNSRRFDIAVDLLGVYNPDTAKVSSVLVNGIPVKDYDINGYTLTIHYNHPGAKLVTVNTTDGDKKGVVKWHVSYNRSDGYRAYQYYKISDFMATLKLLLSKTNFFKALFAKIGIN